jgi:TPR repeat protein
MNEIGYVYQTEKKQYDKALAWFLLASRENNSRAQRNVGTFYRDGLAAPQNYLCALKWYLKAAEGNDIDNTPNHIGWLFENGYGVPLDKYKALEWYCHRGDKSYINTLKNEGFHRSATDKSKFNSIIISSY